MKIMLSPGQIYHSGFVVADICGAIRDWVELTGSGPFVLFESFSFVDPIYRGVPGGPEINLAFGYSGQSYIELIEVTGTDPGIYGEIRGRLHHIGIGVSDLQDSTGQYEVAGIESVFRAAFPFGGGCTYLDTVDSLGFFVELVELNQIVSRMLEQIERAHRTWNRRDHTFLLE